MGSFDIALCKKSLKYIIADSLIKMKIFFFFLATFSFMYFVQCEKYACPETEVNFAESDLDILENVINWHDCGEACELISTCLFWTYRDSDTTCFLKYSDAGLSKIPGH